MRKQFIFTLLCFVAVSVFSQNVNKVLLSPTIPKEVKAGMDFFIEIVVDKGKLETPARFEMVLPSGFTATPKSLSNGEFRFTDQKVIIQWIKLPFQEELTISYNVAVTPGMDGFYVIRGQFSYLEGKDRQTVEMYPQVITVKPKGGSDKEMVMITNKEVETDNFKQRGITCIRQKPYLNDKNEVVVNLLITKGDLTKFGKIQEEVPPGYTAVSTRSKNAIFVFNQSNRQVKFMWMNMPTDEQFVVGYKLVPVDNIPDEQFIITGKFYYTENNTTKTIDIVERGIDLSQPSDNKTE